MTLTLRRRLVVFLTAVAAAALVVGSVAVPTTRADGVPLFVGLPPARLLETRSGLSTVDGQFNAIGARPAGSVLTLPVTGRASVPTGASAVSLNVTVTEPGDPGFVTVYPCDAPRPTASNLNYATGQTIANAVNIKLAANGTVCLFTYATTQLVVDVNGYFPDGSGFGSLSPARVLETRSGLSTIDGQFNAIGARPAGSVLTLPVAGRANVPTGTSAVSLNVTVTEPGDPGFVTVYPCDAPRPTASNLNYATGQTIANAVTVKLAANGTVCLFTYATTQLVVDVNGFYPDGSGFGSISPARLLETRSGLSTVDGQFNAIGARPAGSVLALPVAGRAGVPTNVPAGVTAVSLNVTVTEPGDPGFVTVYPCDAPRPNASNLNFAAGQTIANAVNVKLAANGTVCLFTYATTQLVVDVNGSFPGKPPTPPNDVCYLSTKEQIFLKFAATPVGTVGTITSYPGIYEDNSDCAGGDSDFGTYANASSQQQANQLCGATATPVAELGLEPAAPRAWYLCGLAN